MNVLCHRVTWGQGDDAGKAFDGGELQLLPSLADGDELHAHGVELRLQLAELIPA